MSTHSLASLLHQKPSVEGQQPVQEEHEPRKLALTADEVGDLLKVNTDQVVGLVDKVISKKPISIDEKDTSIRGVLDMKRDVLRVKDLGLGRGVDATNPNPWFNKSSIQVREINPKNIIGTDEGSYLRAYEVEVSSVTNFQASIAASIAVSPAPVKIGIEGEMSRSVSTSKKVVGKKVVTRTIAFSTPLDDLQHKLPMEPDTFEQCLSTWIDERIKQDTHEPMMLFR